MQCRPLGSAPVALRGQHPTPKSPFWCPGYKSRDRASHTDTRKPAPDHEPTGRSLNVLRVARKLRQDVGRQPKARCARVGQTSVGSTRRVRSLREQKGQQTNPGVTFRRCTPRR